MKKRNNNIDFLRGIATLCIVLIHTAFWSGELYLPNWFKNLSLIVDVPVFMYISGISFSFINSISKNVMSLIKQWKKWIFFVLVYALIILIFYRTEFSLKDFLCWIVYYFPNKTSLVVVGGSIWFWIMYIKVTMLCSIIIHLNNCLEKDKEKNIRNLIYIELLIMMMYIYSTSSNTNTYFIDTKTLFYSIIYVLGYLSINYKINIRKTIIYELTTIIITCLLFSIYSFKIADLQVIKGSVLIPYLPFSLLSVILFWYLKDKLKIKEKNPINYIGRNALWFYFAQGISSSLLYYVYGHINNHHYLIVFTIMLTLNLAMSIIIAILLEKVYNLFSHHRLNGIIIKIVKKISPQKIND